MRILRPCPLPSQELLSSRAWPVERQIEWLAAASTLPAERLAGLLPDTADTVGARDAVCDDDLRAGPRTGSRAALLAMAEELKRRSALASKWAQSLQQLQTRATQALADVESSDADRDETGAGMDLCVVRPP